MRPLIGIIRFLIVASLTTVACASPEAVTQTPAEQRIADALQRTEQEASRPAPFAALALAYAARARETADTEYYERGLAVLDDARERGLQSVELERARTWLLLGQHRFHAALAAAEELHRKFPDDLMTYAMLVDAHVELGHYAEAEKAAQWLLDLRPGNVLGLSRAAYLRELFGDNEGALMLLHDAATRIAFEETEQRAWYLVHMSHLHRIDGNLDAALRYANEALRQFPGYHYALDQLAQVRTAEGAHEVAWQVRKLHAERAPHPENFFLLGQAARRAGRTAEAARAFHRFEAGALAETYSPDNANRHLVEYYADEKRDAAAALEIAERQLRHRGDVFTRMALAWAWYRNGEFERANSLARQAMGLGIRYPDLAYRAAIIARAAEAQWASKLFDYARRVAPQHELADNLRNPSAAGMAEVVF